MVKGMCKCDTCGKTVKAAEISIAIDEMTGCHKYLCYVCAEEFKNSLYTERYI